MRSAMAIVRAIVGLGEILGMKVTQQGNPGGKYTGTHRAIDD